MFSHNHEISLYAIELLRMHRFRQTDIQHQQNVDASVSRIATSSDQLDHSKGTREKLIHGIATVALRSVLVVDRRGSILLNTEWEG